MIEDGRNILFKLPLSAAYFYHIAMASCLMAVTKNHTVSLILIAFLLDLDPPAVCRGRANDSAVRRRKRRDFRRCRCAVGRSDAGDFDFAAAGGAGSPPGQDLVRRREEEQTHDRNHRR